MHACWHQHARLVCIDTSCVIASNLPGSAYLCWGLPCVPEQAVAHKAAAQRLPPCADLRACCRPDRPCQAGHVALAAAHDIASSRCGLVWETDDAQLPCWHCEAHLAGGQPAKGGHYAMGDQQLMKLDLPGGQHALRIHVWPSCGLLCCVVSLPKCQHF